MKRAFLLPGLLVLLTSCSFNKMFLLPTKIPEGVKGLTMRSASDTIAVLFSGDNYQPTFVRNGRDTIDPGFSIESVVFRSANGHKLNGWFLKPRGTTASVTILHFHGNAGFLLRQYRAISPLLRDGFQIFLFDYSGFGFSEGKATKGNVLTDALSSLDYLKSREDVKNTRLVVYGQSLGGHLSAVVATQRQTEVDALVIEGAFSSHKDIAAYVVPVIGRIVVRQSYCATKSIRNFNKPLLVVHSTEDQTIPLYMGKKIFDAANSPKEFFEIKKCHMCGPDFYGDDIARKIKGMLAGS